MVKNITAEQLAGEIDTDEQFTRIALRPEDASCGVELLYDSLHEIILDLPDDTTILPGNPSVTSDGRYENGSPGEPLKTQLGDLRDELNFDESELTELKQGPNCAG